MLGKERAADLYMRLVDESRERSSRVSRGIKALYRLKDLVVEGKKTDHMPEALLDFRRAELSQAYFDKSD